MDTFSLQRPPVSVRQRGASLLFALMALVAFSLGAAALVRTVDSSALVAGNLGFKQDSTVYAGQAAEAAINWARTADGGTNVPSAGFYATSYEELDPANRWATNTTRAVVDWAGDGCGSNSYTAGTWSGGCLTPVTSVTANGNTTQYVITRLCSSTGAADASGNVCRGPLNMSSGLSPNRGELCYSAPCRFIPRAVTPYYRVVVRTAGARNTVTYTETIVHF